MLERVHGVRQMVASDVGIILPKVRLRDNMRLEQNTYRVKIAGVAVAQGTIYPQMQLAMDSGVTTGKVTGIDVREPAFDRPATWIEPAQRERAEMLGYTVVDAGTVAATAIFAFEDTLDPAEARKPLPSSVRRAGLMTPPFTVVCVLTGHGLKDADSVLATAPTIAAIPPSVDDLLRLVEKR